MLDSATNAGYVAVVNCIDVVVKDLTLTKNGQGVLFAYTKDSRIENIIARSNGAGIHLVHSSNNIVSNITSDENKECKVPQNRGWFVVSEGDGIFLWSSFGNTLNNISATKNFWNGVYLGHSSNNNLRNDTTKNNEYGIQILYASSNNSLSNMCVADNKRQGINLYESSNNLLYHNNFINNEQDAYDTTGTNSWDNGLEGNYWSDYTGVDANGDSIGDTPYEIPGSAGTKDNYPLMKLVSI